MAVWPMGVEGAELGLNVLVAGHTHPVLLNCGQVFRDVAPLLKGQESIVKSLKRREVFYFCFAEWKIQKWEPDFCLESLGKRNDPRNEIRTTYRKVFFKLQNDIQMY